LTVENEDAGKDNFPGFWKSILRVRTRSEKEMEGNRSSPSFTRPSHPRDNPISDPPTASILPRETPQARFTSGSDTPNRPTSRKPPASTTSEKRKKRGKRPPCFGRQARRHIVSLTSRAGRLAPNGESRARVRVDKDHRHHHHGHHRSAGNKKREFLTSFSALVLAE
jgi:hypothetical protein